MMKTLFLLIPLALAGCNNASINQQTPEEYAGNCRGVTSKYVLTDAEAWRVTNYDTLTTTEFLARPEIGRGDRDTLRETTIFTVRANLRYIGGQLVNPDDVSEIPFLRLYIGFDAYVPEPTCPEVDASPYGANYQMIYDSIKAWYGWPEPGRLLDVYDSVEVTGVGISNAQGGGFAWMMMPVLSVKRLH